MLWGVLPKHAFSGYIHATWVSLYSFSQWFPTPQERCAAEGIQLECWFPLGGRESKGEILRDPVINSIAKAHGKSAAQVIIRWHLQEGFSVIPGTSNPDYIKENISVFDFALSNVEMAKIRALNKEKRYFNMSYEEQVKWFSGWNPTD